ncbi:adenylyl-sulfate kinase [Opitutus terrae]|uniref:Adenylyl-sulfate kinase n=1 Tax=Opitutus terrae (strain DSM 11246 / JCM 15787 / PB90-1) TaxID=452637 RepID=B1ZZN0_OPITP|nr:adenylyl-sulfate kinase [Opitutus terrae]ACB77216.1 adenylylsulfate kinase [Opitutus terrae PB90-1]
MSAARHVSRLPEAAADRASFTPHVFWLCGLSGAGKSTLAARLATALRARAIPVLELDGDRLRGGLCAGLGFSDADRSENLRRAAETAKLGVSSQLCVVASFITPLENQRQLIARTIDRDCLSFVFLDAPLDVCRARDVKGLYARAKTGAVPHMTGLTSAFEPPRNADLTIETSRETIDRCSERLVAFALTRLRPPR